MLAVGLILQRLSAQLKPIGDKANAVPNFALDPFIRLFEFIAHKALDAAVGMRRLIEFAVKSRGGRGPFQLFCA